MHLDFSPAGRQAGRQGLIIADARISLILLLYADHLAFYLAAICIGNVNGFVLI